MSPVGARPSSSSCDARVARLRSRPS
jgi:hypothetical protein